MSEDKNIYHYKVDMLERVSSELYRLILVPTDNRTLQYYAGQYVEFMNKPDGSDAKPFSIACAPRDDGHLYFHLRYREDNPYAREVMQQVQNSQFMTLRGPFGNLALRTEPKHPIIMLAGGTGLAPLKALVEEYLQTNTDQELYLYWGVRHKEELFLTDTIEQWLQQCPRLHYIPVVSEATADEQWPGRQGLVHQAVLNDFSDLSQFHVYASGPPDMVFTALESFGQQGLPKSQFYSDTLG